MYMYEVVLSAIVCYDANIYMYDQYYSTYVSNCQLYFQRFLIVMGVVSEYPVNTITDTSVVVVVIIITNTASN